MFLRPREDLRWVGKSLAGGLNLTIISPSRRALVKASYFPRERRNEETKKRRNEETKKETKNAGEETLVSKRW